MKPIFKSPQEDRSYSFFKANFLKQVKKLSKTANSIENAVPFFFNLNADYQDDKEKKHCLMVFGNLTSWRSHIKKAITSEGNVSGQCYVITPKEGSHLELFLYNEKGKSSTKTQVKKIRKRFKEVVPYAKLQLSFVDSMGILIPGSKADNTNEEENDDIALDEVNQHTLDTGNYNETVEEKALETENISIENLSQILKKNAKNIADDIKEFVKELKSKSIRPRKALSRLDKMEKHLDKDLTKGLNINESEHPRQTAKQLKALRNKFNKDILELRDYLKDLNLDKEEHDELKDTLKAALRKDTVGDVMDTIVNNFTRQAKQFTTNLDSLKDIYQSLNTIK